MTAYDNPIMSQWRKILAVILFFFAVGFSNAQSWNIDSVMQELDKAILSRSAVDKAKTQKIENIKIMLHQLRPDEVQARYRLAESLYDEYKSFTYDSAFKYAVYMDNLARELRDDQRISSVKIKMGFIFLSSGLFKEAIDTLLTVQPENLDKEQRIEYYSILGRTYHDLADYDGSPVFTKIYNRTGNSYLRKAIELIPEYSFQYYMIHGAEQLKAEQYESARETFHLLYNYKPMTEHQRAITVSTLGYIYTCLGRKDKASFLLAVAAISDIKSSIKETVALRNLAQLLYEKGENERAYRYIKIALEDADFYNARQRIKEVGKILPIIEGAQLKRIERQKEQLILYLLMISFLGVIAIVLLIISAVQFYRLKHVKELLQAANVALTGTNKKLSEANRIKEKYIGYYFNVNATYLDRIEKIQKSLSRKITLRQYDELQNFLKKDLDPRTELDDLNRNFDKIVLSLFPNFVQKFNELFHKEDQFILKEGELLNKELRIFALIRMGITDNEKIAKILNLSVNTIYTYKTKIKNRSIISNNEFEEHLMRIDALD
jgi:tetratricopeptide (TPR) repeat protein